MLAIVYWRVKVPAMEYFDCDNRLVPSAANTGSDMPGAIEGADIEPAAALLFGQDRFGNSP
ncbi:MAG TPA: hypothetical protein VHQ95_06035 [Pyrinomonadaceae bacterium]|nr:hypothetical protein [Pyrinomonadaceae bacterium]